MTDWKDDITNIVCSGRIKVPYIWSVGETGSRFLVALRDHREIWGIKCRTCGKVYVYPVKTCPDCFIQNEEWVKVKDTGILESFTVVRYSHSMHPLKAPLIYGLVKLDGADGALLHLMGNVDEKQLKAGMRVKAVFAEERTGSILDIKFFAPA
jgi:hypothetical protein